MVLATTNNAETKAVSLVNITKTFPGIVANDNVNLSVERGEIHAICGENGAGKSVLMKILYGIHQPDSGEMTINGENVSFHSPKDAIAHEIGMVHQHFMLADNLTVLENIILGSEPHTTTYLPNINFRKARKSIIELNESYGLHVDLDQTIDTLSIGQLQRVEIIKALYRGARILILDEPTACLVPHEVDELFNNIREMKEKGETIIFIDHKLEEVIEISDRITVLRAGKTIDTVKKADTNSAQLAEMMIGSSLPTPDSIDKTVRDTIALNITDLVVRGDRGERAVKSLDMHINKGEIVGVAGVEGNGQIELIQSILGIRDAEEGSIEMLTIDANGNEEFKDCTNTSVSTRRKQGLGYIPSDRFKLGIMPSAPLWENVMLGHQRQEPYCQKGFWLTKKKTISQTEAIIEKFDIRTPGPNVAIHALSGGNQQKLVIGREMVMNLGVLLAAHPTRGIDIGAQAAVWEHLRVAKSEGLAILLISADLDELLGLSDRLLVILGGEITADLDPSSVTSRELGVYMTGADKESASTEKISAKS